jgi:uncharacterized membrane protein
MAAEKTLIERIEYKEAILLRFRTRFEPLQAFEAELVSGVGPNTFLIVNTVVWDAVIAERDLLR